MTFNLGFLAGVGRAQREVNQRNYDATLNSEKTSNEATASMLHDMMTRDDVTPETKSAALQSLMQFSQIKGMPTGKHRQAAMDPVLSAFHQDRQFDPNAGARNSLNQQADQAQQQVPAQAQQVDNTAAQADKLNVGGLGMGGALMGITGAMHSAAQAAPTQLPAQFRDAAASPQLAPQPRKDFLGADEVAWKKGTSEGMDIRGRVNAISQMNGGQAGGQPGSGGGVGNTGLPIGYNMYSGKTDRLTPRSAMFQDPVTGQMRQGFATLEPSTGQWYAENQLPIKGNVTPFGVDTYTQMRGVDGQGHQTITEGTKSGFATAGPQEQAVRKVFRSKINTDGTKSLIAVDPFSTDQVGELSQGVNMDRDQRQKLQTGIAATQQHMDIARQQQIERTGNYLYNYKGTALDPVTGKEFTPSGAPLDTQGNPYGRLPYSQIRPPAAAQSAAYVAQDAIANVQMIRGTAQQAEQQFGPLKGRLMGELTKIGAIDAPEIASFYMELMSTASMNPAIHSMRTFRVAEEAARTLGDLGQPYENFMTKLATLEKFYQQVQQNRTQPIVRHAGAVPQRPTAQPPQGSNPSPAAAPSRYKTGDRVTYKGKPTVVKAVHPDGSIEVE